MELSELEKKQKKNALNVLIFSQKKFCISGNGTSWPQD